MGFEGVELFGPERLHLVEPRLESDKGLGAQPVDAKASVVGNPLLFNFNFDEAAGPEHSQVPAHGGAAHQAGLGKFASPARTFPEQFHHLTPGGVSQCSECGIKIIHCLHIDEQGIGWDLPQPTASVA